MWKQLWLRSQTKALAYAQASSAGALLAFNNLSDFVNDPHFKDYLSNFTVPKWVYILIATMGVLTWLAHGREQDV